MVVMVLCGCVKNMVIVGVDFLLHEIFFKGVGFGVLFAKLLVDVMGWIVLLMVDLLQCADVIVVFGGEHYGCEAYGMLLVC
ncbi:MAG: hypothetical protein O7C59_09450 [Rickettsia endosymbiont of Ixodes persulcatus]|nr:hypothetical protein [Rickettsia endosymbiont of Ixodes persulcatus]